MDRRISQLALDDDNDPTVRAQPALDDGDTVAGDKPFSLQDFRTRQPQTAIERAITLLISKGVYKDDEQMAELQFGRLLNPMSSPDPEYYKEAKRRAENLSMQTDTNSVDVLERYQFSEEEFPGYETLLMVRDKKTHVNRRQHSSLCYMHAPAVVQYYAIWHNRLKSGDNSLISHGMFDVRAHVLKSFSARKLVGHVFDNEGGQSTPFLRQILKKDSQYLTLTADKAGEYEGCLKKYGPGLVSKFIVHPCFRDTERHKHYGKPKKYSKILPLIDYGELEQLEGDAPLRHAMVLVGAKGENETLYFLLQNWWEGKPFVEVDEEYFKSCEAEVTFVVTPQDGVHNKFDTLLGHHFETSQLED